jgi:hypothetical protein
MYCNINRQTGIVQKMIKTVDKYATSKTKLMNCCRTTMIAIIIFFSFLLGLSMIGTTSVAAGSTISGSQIGGMQELQEEEQHTPQICSSNSSNSAVTDGNNNTSTTTGIASGNNNTATSLYQNPEYGIQILCPEDWVYMEMANPPPFDFQVTFMSIMDAFEVGTTLESGATLQMLPSVTILTMEVPFGNADVRLLGDTITRGLALEGQQIISTNLNATLSGMPAFEVVTVEPENRTRGIQVWTVQGDRAYAVAYISHESRFDQSLPIAQDMISSFTITNETSTTQLQTSPEEPPPSTITSTITTNGSNQAMNLEAAKEQYLAVWNQTEFQIAFHTFIEPGSATGYGIYEEHANDNIFTPGETIQLYLEPVAFGHQQQTLDEDNGRNTLYLMNLTADIIISDVTGNELARIEDEPVGSLISHRQNTETHVTLTVTQDIPFPVGDYIITYIVYDQVKGQSFQIDRRITIIATAGDDDGKAGTGTATVQGEQQQQPEEVEWLPYENATYGVRMLYPSTWTYAGNPAGEDDRFVIVSNFFSPEETNWAFAMIAIDNMPTDLESSLNDTINNYNQDPFVRDFQVLSTSMNNFTLAEMPAYTLEATYTDVELGPQHVLVVEAIVDNKGYAIQYSASPETYQRYFPIAESMIESFEITQQLQQQQEEEQQPQQNQEDSFSAIPGLF